MDARWLTVAGLVLDIFGASIVAYPLIVTKRKAVEIGVTRLAGNTMEENLRLPAVRDRLQQSRLAKWGLGLIIAGFFLQLVGSWPR
jgi:hypothetical protein